MTLRLETIRAILEATEDETRTIKACEAHFPLIEITDKAMELRNKCTGLRREDRELLVFRALTQNKLLWIGSKPFATSRCWVLSRTSAS
jgi:hypothetical protein